MFKIKVTTNKLNSSAYVCSSKSVNAKDHMKRQKHVYSIVWTTTTSNYI